MHWMDKRRGAEERAEEGSRVEEEERYLYLVLTDREVSKI